MKMNWQANTSVKISGSEKKGEQEHVRDIASIKRVTRKFHVVVVQNKSKEMYKKVCCTRKDFFLLIRLTDFFAVLVAVAV